MTKRKTYTPPEDQRTLAELAAEAIKCSHELTGLSTVLSFWHTANRRLRQVLYHGTGGGPLSRTDGMGWGDVDTAVNRHPISVVWANTAARVTGGVDAAFLECEALARGTVPS